mgnify:CR=1 FL=1
MSHETIYQAVYAHGTRGLPVGLHQCLHRRRRCRKHRVFGPPAPAKSPLGDFNLIGLRPAEAEGREVVGHFEGDLIVGSFNRSAIVTIFDRCSRFNLLADLPEGHNAQATLAALVELFERVPEHLRKTLTWDQGREMAGWDQLELMVGIDVFFANPHAPWERPTNENGNGLLRRYVGKGTDLSVYGVADLRAIEARVNDHELGFAVLFGFDHPLEAARMRFSRVTAHDKNQISVLDVHPMVGHRTTPKTRSQTGHRRGVSNTCLSID